MFLSGPIVVKNKGTDSAQAKFGFFLAGELEMEKDPDPSAIGNYIVKDDVLSDLAENPLRPSVSGLGFNKIPNSLHWTIWKKSLIAKILLTTVLPYLQNLIISLHATPTCN